MPDVMSFSGTHRCFSNFFPSPVTLVIHGKRVVFPTNEHGFVWHKTLNPVTRQLILSIEKPGQVKRLGRNLQLRHSWDDIKVSIMQELCLEKFKQNPRLREILMSTEDGLLIEGNVWHDNFWGDCHCRKCENIEGDNTLGRILMTLRDEVFDV